MNEKDIVTKLVEEKRLARREASDLVETFFSLLRDKVNTQVAVSMPGFGRFERKKAKGRFAGRILYEDDPADGLFVHFTAHEKLLARTSRDFVKEAP